MLPVLMYLSVIGFELFITGSPAFLSLFFSSSLSSFLLYQACFLIKTIRVSLSIIPITLLWQLRTGKPFIVDVES